MSLWRASWGSGRGSQITDAAFTIGGCNESALTQEHYPTSTMVTNCLRRGLIAALVCMPAVTDASIGRVLGPQQVQEPYRERVDVPRVLLDVRVVQDSGRPIEGLVASDFSVRIDGKVSAIDTAEWVPPRAEDERTTKSNESHARTPINGRWIVLLYQKKTDLSDVQGLMRFRRDFAAFAKLISEDDRVAILSFDSSLHVWLDFTNDVKGVRQVMEHDILVGTPPQLPAGPFPSLAAAVPSRTGNSTTTIEKSLRLIGEVLTSVPGAKSIIVFSSGMGTWSPRAGVVQMARDYADTFFALVRARVSVFSVDIMRADYHPRQEALEAISRDTGGIYLKSHVFTTAVFDRIAGALAGYYVLSVVPPDAQTGGRGIDVSLRRRKGTVFAKRAYSAQ